MELDEDFPDINAAPHIRFERFDRDDDLIIEFDNMFSNNGKRDNLIVFVRSHSFHVLNPKGVLSKQIYFYFFGIQLSFLINRKASV